MSMVYIVGHTLQGSKLPTRYAFGHVDLARVVTLHAFQLLVLILKPRQGTYNNHEVEEHSVQQSPSINFESMDITNNKRHWTV